MPKRDFITFKATGSVPLRHFFINRHGDLVFNDDGEAVYTPSHKRSKYQEAITFHERTGGSLMAMDGKKKNHDVAKTFAVMAEMTKLHSGVFANLVGKDIKVCEAIFALLMD
mgnify:CR=1 FL=1